MHNYIILVQQLAFEIKTAFSSFIYRKALKLTPSALSEVSLGKVVTLITKDLHIFEQSIRMVNEAWMCLVQSSVLYYLLYVKMAAVSLIGVAVLVGSMPIQSKYNIK